MNITFFFWTFLQFVWFVCQGWSSKTRNALAAPLLLTFYHFMIVYSIEIAVTSPDNFWIRNWQHLIRRLFFLQLLSGLLSLWECMNYHGLLVTFVLSIDVGILFAVTDTSWVVFVKLHMHWWKAISTVIAKVVSFTCRLLIPNQLDQSNYLANQ